MRLINQLSTVNFVRRDQVKPGQVYKDNDQRLCLCVDPLTQNQPTHSYIYLDDVTGRVNKHYYEGWLIGRIPLVVLIPTGTKLEFVLDG